MSEAKFVLSKKVLIEQIKKLENLGLKISYSYKTNKEVGNVLQKVSDCDFSIHAREEIEMIDDKKRIWFFTQAENVGEFENILGYGIRKFVIGNEIDLKNLLEAVGNKKVKIFLSLRMKFQEHRIGTGKYFVYGMSSSKVNKLVLDVIENEFVEKIGIHIHRKSQNLSEWEIKSEIRDSLSDEVLNKISFINFGGGLPSIYRSYIGKSDEYIFNKIKESIEFLKEKRIESYIEPGRFLAAPGIKLFTEIIQVQGKNIVVNTTIYNCALDNVLTGTKMLVEGEIFDEALEGQEYLIKGNSPTRDDIFRYKVKLKSANVGDKIIFLNAGAYNYTTDFFGYKKLKTEIVETF